MTTNSGSDNKSIDLWQKYAVFNPTETAKKFYNHDSDLLISYARDAGERLLQLIGIPEAVAVLGGSLGYDAAIEGSYDIDLRILLPDTNSTPERIREVSDKICRQEKFNDVMVIGQGSDSVIYHTWKMVKIENLPDKEVYLTLNIQAQATYSGLAGIAKRLPQIVIDRYVAAKGKSNEEGQKLEYKIVKEHWKCFLNWLISNGIHTMNDSAIAELLVRNDYFFPLFLKEKQR